MIKIGFSKTNSWISKVIRKITKSQTSHAFMVLDADAFFGQQMILQADWNGFFPTPMAKFQKENEIVAIIEPAVPLDAGVKEAWGWLNTAYDYTGFVGMAVVYFGRWFKKKWHNPFHDSNAMFCSEAIVKVMAASGYPGVDKLDPDSTGPQDLWDFLIKTNG